MDSASFNVTSVDAAPNGPSDDPSDWGKGFLFALWVCFAIAFVTAPLFYSLRIRTCFTRRFMPRSIRNLDEDVIDSIRRERRGGAEQGTELELDESTKREFLGSLLGSFTVELTKEDFKSVERSHWATKDLAIGNTKTNYDVEEGDIYDQNMMTVVVLPATMRSAEESKLGKPESAEVSMMVNESLTRMVSCTCAICLESYIPEDKVCWSSNETCRHAFHKACLMEWFAAYMRRCAFDDVSALTCPCCRQAFVDTSHRQLCTLKKSADVAASEKTEVTGNTEDSDEDSRALEEGAAALSEDTPHDGASGQQPEVDAEQQ